MLSSLMCWSRGGRGLGLLATYVSTVADRSYGMALFIALPFLVGFVAVFVRGIRRTGNSPRGFHTSLLSVLLLGGLLLVFAMEGACAW